MAKGEGLMAHQPRYTIEEIKELLAKATPGPWKECFHLKSIEHDQTCGCGYRGGIWSKHTDQLLLEMDIDRSVLGSEMIPVPERETTIANAKFIAAAPTIIAQLVEQVAWLDDALQPVDSVDTSPEHVDELRDDRHDGRGDPV